MISEVDITSQNNRINKRVKRS